MSTLRDLTYLVQLTGVETLQGVPGAGTEATVQNDQFNRGPTQLKSTTTPPLTKVSYSTQTMTGSAVTIDLTAAPGTQDAIDGTGLKVNLIHFKNKGTNNITVAPGASNAYELFGSAVSIVLKPGMELTVKFNDNLADVSATVKNVSFTGTASDTCDVMFGLG